MAESISDDAMRLSIQIVALHLSLVYRALIGGVKQNLPVKPFRSWPRLIAYG